MHQKMDPASTIDMKKAAQALLPLIAPPESLSGVVIARIREEVRKAARRLAWITGAGIAGAVAALAGFVRLLVLL